MNGTHAVRLDSRGAVDRVLSTRAYLRVFMPRLEVAPPGMDPHSTQELQARIDRLVDECGCGVGSAAALVGLGACIVYLAAFAPPAGVWGTLWRCAFSMFAGATLGKVAGVLRARVELRGVLLTLRESLVQELG